jgi:hypothetical protein
VILYTFFVTLSPGEGESQLRSGIANIHLPSTSYYFVQRTGPLISTYISHQFLKSDLCLKLSESMRRRKAGWSIGFTTILSHGFDIFLRSPPKLMGASDYYYYLISDHCLTVIIMNFLFVIITLDCHRHNRTIAKKAIISLYRLI